jgi:hypothetical protein
MEIMNLVLLSLFIFLGITLIVCKNEVANTKLGKMLLLSLSLFYIIRLVSEFIFAGGTAKYLIPVFIVYILVYVTPLFLKNK